MMREVLRAAFAGCSRQARARRAETASRRAFPETPDLVLIDGGKGPIRCRARGIVARLGVDGRDARRDRQGRPTATPAARLFSSRAREPFKLSPRDPALYFVQRLRDEAHRFAIGTHRARRKKEFAKSPLDEIPASARRASAPCSTPSASAKAISRAGLSDLEKDAGHKRRDRTPGVSIFSTTKG